VHERESPALAAERAGADLGKCREVVEELAFEVGDDVLLDLAKIAGDGCNEVAAEVGGRIELGDLAWAQTRGELELGARLEPGREMVTARMEDE
jgi:hypothetical protein